MMDRFEFGKIAGALLFSLLIVFGLRLLGEVVFRVNAPEKPGAAVEVSAEAEEETKIETEGDSRQADALPTATPTRLAQLLAGADVVKGQKVFKKKCASCHKVNAGTKGGVGPNLAGIVGRTIGAAAGFAYSKNMKAKAAEKGTWSYENINTFLIKPRAFVPKTRMTMTGLKKEEDRANLMAFLKSLSPDAPPFPSK